MDGRLPSAVLGLHLERSGFDLRSYDPAQRRWLPTPRERAESERSERIRIEADVERLREEIAALKRRLETGG